MPAPAASSVPSLRLFTWTPDGWAKVPASSLLDGAWGIDVRADSPRLVRVHQGQAREVRTSPQGREAVEAIVFALGALINAPIVGGAPPAARAGRPSRSSRRLLIFSSARWQWEAAERTDAKPGDVLRLIERSGTPVDVDGQPGPAMFRWEGEAGAEVPYDVDALGPVLREAVLIRQAFDWLGVSVEPGVELPVPPPSEAAPAPERRRRRVLPTPPPPARRALSTVPLDDEGENTDAAPVPIPDLPPEIPAIDDDPTQEFPNMPANRAQPIPPPEQAADAAPAEVSLREPTPEAKAQVRALYDNGQINAAVDLWIDARGYPDDMGRQAQADMMKALGRHQPPPPARRGGVGGVPDLRLLTDAKPIDDEERDYMARVPAEFDERAEPEDYEAAQEAAARAEITIPPESEPASDDPESVEQIRTVPVSFPTGETRTTFTRNAAAPTVDEDGAEPDLGADAYEEAPAYIEQDQPVRRGDVLPRFGRCVSIVQRNEVIELTDDEREAFVVELTEMPSLFAALEEQKRDFMSKWKKNKEALQKREIHLGDAIRTFKELRPVEVAGLLKDGWVTEIDANHPARIFGTRKPNESDQLQEDLFDRRRDEDEDEDEDGVDDEEGEEE